MRIEDYPIQEPFTEIGALYHQEALRRAGDLEGREANYGPDPYQSLAIYASENPNGDVFCVMHGGGWTNGYKEWMAFMAPAMTSRGVTFVSLGYRLAPKHVFPAGFDDCCDAVAWVYGGVSEFGGDRERIFVGGHSAGGHYAALMALRQDWQAERHLPANIIKGALPISGTYEFGPDSGFSARPRFLGPAEAGTEITASPNQYVHREAPPFFVAYGEKDFPHLKCQAHDFVQALRNVKVDVLATQLTGCDHLGASYVSGDSEGEWCGTAAQFMRTR